MPGFSLVGEPVVDAESEIQFSRDSDSDSAEEKLPTWLNKLPDNPSRLALYLEPPNEEDPVVVIAERPVGKGWYMKDQLWDIRIGKRLFRVSTDILLHFTPELISSLEAHLEDEERYGMIDDFERSGKTWYREIEEGNPAAWMLILCICHHRLDLLPKTVPVSLLCSLAVLTKEHRLETPVLPFARKWVRFVLERRPLDGGRFQWLCISYTFGMREVFRAVYRHLVVNSTTSLLAKWYVPKSKVRTPTQRLPKLARHLPNSLILQIKRNHLILSSRYTKFSRALSFPSLVRVL